MNDEKPISLEVLQDRVNTEGKPQLENGILIEVPRGWFETVKHDVDAPRTQELPPEPDRPVH